MLEGNLPSDWCGWSGLILETYQRLTRNLLVWVRLHYTGLRSMTQTGAEHRGLWTWTVDKSHWHWKHTGDSGHIQWTLDTCHWQWTLNTGHKSLTVDMYGGQWTWVTVTMQGIMNSGHNSLTLNIYSSVTDIRSIQLTVDIGHKSLKLEAYSGQWARSHWNWKLHCTVHLTQITDTGSI